jgi:hypothetical protein
MKTRTTLILLLITLGVAAWLLLKERSGPVRLQGHLLFDWSGSARLMEKEKLTVDVKPAEVAGIDLKSSTVEISLRRQADGSWEMIRGVPDRADGEGVKLLLTWLETARIADILAHGEVEKGEVSAASLGLDDAGAWRVSWLDAGGKSMAEARVGKTAPLGGTAYVQFAGVPSRPDIYLVQPDLRQLLARPLDSWRDPHACRFKEEELGKLVIRVGEGEVELSRTFQAVTAAENPGDSSAGAALLPGPWLITRPLASATTDPNVTKELVAEICGLKALSWLTYSETTDKPLVEISVFPAAAGAKGSTLSFFADPAVTDPAAENATAICHDVQRKAAFKVKRETVDYFALVDSPGPLRSRKLPVMMEPGVISTVEVRTPGDSVTLARVGNKWSWRPLSGGAWSDAEVEQLEKLIAAVNEGEVLDYASDSLTDPKEFALDAPDYVVTFAAGRHMSLDQLTPMNEKNSRSLRIAIRQDGHIFANYAGDAFVYRIGPEIPSAIPQRFIQWRTLSLISFSLPQLQRLVQTLGETPPLELQFNGLTLQWTSATRAGQDVTSLLLKGAAETLASRLGTLSAARWLEKPDEALKVLEKPAVTVEVQYRDFGEKASEERPVTATLSLAPLPSPNALVCYGKLSTIPDPFLISIDVLRAMSAPLLTK